MPYADNKRNQACRADYDRRHKALRADIAKRYDKNHPEMRMLQDARRRAKAAGYTSNLKKADIIIPVFCPALGVPLVRGVGKVGPASPSLDRIDSSKGYMKGNVIVVSFKANTMKSNGTIAELQRLVDFYKSIGAP